MSLQLEVQRESSASGQPDDLQLRQWAEAALSDRGDAPVELVIRIVDEAESQRLNLDYCRKDRPTNVLSFPFESPEVIALPLLGDLVICAGVVTHEAAEQGKTLEAHWAHMVIHGVLHLLGYDHLDDAEAETMEQIEADLLARLDFSDPYH